MSSLDNDKNFQEIEEKDSQYEGRDRYFMDVDRMINEGMARGTVIHRGNQKPIDEDRNLVEEEPPHKVE
ncbi:hypothetical protein ACNQFZ_06120 [Schinkia sp. CFF1]